MRRYSIKQIIAASLSAVMLVTAVPTVAYAEEPEQSTEQTQETTIDSEEAVQETQAVESEKQEQQSEEIKNEPNQNTQEQTETVEEQTAETAPAEEVVLSQKFEVQPGNEEAKNEDGKACFVSGVDPESIKLTESSGSGWNITALGELRPEQFVLEGAFANMVVTSVTAEPREDDNQVSDTIVLTTEEAVNAGGVDGQNEYVMDKYPTGKITVSAGVFGQDDPITVETPVETPNITLKDLKADGESVETVPADAKSITGTLVIDGKLEDYAYFFSPDAQEEDGKRKNEVAVLNAGGGLSSSTISVGKVSGDYHNELGFEVELKDVSSETGQITIPQEENAFHTALTVSIPLEVKEADTKDVVAEESDKENEKNAEDSGNIKSEESGKDQTQQEVKDTEESKAEESVKTEENKSDQMVDNEEKSEETKATTENKKSIQKASVEDVNKRLAALKNSIPGKIVAQTKSFLVGVQTAIEGTQDPELKLNTGRTTYYGGESVNKLTLKLSGPVTFKKEKIAKLTEKNYGDYFILGDGFSDLKIKDIDVSDSSDKELTLIVRGNVKSDNGYYTSASVKVNTPVLSGHDDLLTTEVAVGNLTVSVKNLKADGDEAESINCDTKNITGTIEIEKVDGIDTCFKETEAFTKQPIKLELGGAFYGAKSRVTIDSKDGNKLNFKITVANRPMTEDYGTIKVPGSFAFTNADISVPDIKINKIELIHSKGIEIEKTEDGLQYTIEADVNGGTFKEALTADNLNFTAPFNNQTADMNIQMKKNDKGEMNGFVATITLNPNSMGNHATGTMTLAMDKVYYPDGEHTYGLPLSLSIQDNYEKSKAETESGEEVDTGAVVGDLLTNVFVYTVASALLESNPIAAGIINVGVGALSSFLSGNYTTETESDRDVLMRAMQENLDTTLAHIDAATQETKDYMSFKMAQEAQDNVNELANRMKDIYSTDINFVNATKTIMEMNAGGLDADDAEYVDEVLQSVYSSESQTNKKGIVSQTYKDNLIQLGRKLLDTQKDDNGNARSAFDNYEYICQNVYGMNVDGFDNRKTTNDDLLTMYEYGYKVMITAVCYDIQKHKAFGTELDKKIKEQDELLADSSLSKEKKAVIKKNKKTYTNLRKTVQSAVTVSENVLKQLETQNTAIQNAYNTSKGQLDKEVAAYNSEDRIAKCYWINKDLSLNATIMDANENIKRANEKVYQAARTAMKENNHTGGPFLGLESMDEEKLFDNYWADKSGITNKWELNDYLSPKDSENTSSPFYNSITEDEIQSIRKKLEQKNSSETIMNWLEKYLYVDGKPIAEVMNNLTQEDSVLGIYLEGWQTSERAYWTWTTDTCNLSRYVKILDEKSNITEREVCELSFELWHKGFFGWAGTSHAEIRTFCFYDSYGGAFNNRNPESVICIKKAY